MSKRYAKAPCRYALCYIPTPPSTLLQITAGRAIPYDNQHDVNEITFTLNGCFQFLFCAGRISLQLPISSAAPCTMHHATIPSTDPLTPRPNPLLPYLSNTSRNFHHFASPSLHQWPSSSYTRNHWDAPAPHCTCPITAETPTHNPRATAVYH